MRRALTVLLLVLIVAGGGWWWWTAHSANVAKTAARNRRPDTIPVMVAKAQRQDVPIFLDGLGTAQASATVTVKPQVDGVLTEVRFKEGQDVHAGDILAKIDPRTYQATLDQTIGKKAMDQANLANARVDLARYSKLAATAYTSAQQADTQKAMVAQLEAQVAQDQAQVDSARATLSYTTVVAPVDGRIGFRQVDQGNLVHASDSNGLLLITTLKPISVVFTLPQQSLRAVTAAQLAGTPEVLALPQGGNEQNALDRGTLTVLDNQVDSATGTIKLKATFPNERLQLWPGAFVTVRLKVDTQRDVTTVPPVAVQRGPQGPYLYVVNADQTAGRRPIKVGHEDQTASIVTDGLKPGETVVVDGASRLTDRAKVTVVAPPGVAPTTDGSAPVAEQPEGAPGRRRNRGAT